MCSNGLGHTSCVQVQSPSSLGGGCKRGEQEDSLWRCKARNPSGELAHLLGHLGEQPTPLRNELVGL